MKKLKILILAVVFAHSVTAQKKWFNTFSDSIELVKSANTISDEFITDIKKLHPSIKFQVKTILNTTPYLIFYYNNGKEKTINLPLWDQVIPQQKSFFYEVAGSEKEGKNAFGLFFNGFYLLHELAHALQDIAEDSLSTGYKNEYLANTIAILWWRKHNKKKELKQCYIAAKKMWSKLPKPFANDISADEYFTKNYEAASQNPYVYGYMQFKQFIDIYEDKTLVDFDTYVKKYLTQTSTTIVKYK